MLIREQREPLVPWPGGHEVALVRSIGSGAFAENLLSYVLSHVPIDSVILFASREGRTEPYALATRRSRKKLDRTALRYASHFAHLDPNASLVDKSDRTYLITRSQLSDIHDDSYRSICWMQTGVVDRYSFFTGAGGERWSLNLYREKATGCFSEGEATKLEEIGALAAAAAERHIAAHRLQSPDLLWRRFENALEQCAELSPRERQVCRFIVRGLATDKIASELQIGQASVVTFRRRAYAKLGVQSRHDLLQTCSRLAAKPDHSPA